MSFYCFPLFTTVTFCFGLLKSQFDDPEHALCKPHPFLAISSRQTTAAPAAPLFSMQLKNCCNTLSSAIRFHPSSGACAGSREMPHWFKALTATYWTLCNIRPVCVEEMFHLCALSYKQLVWAKVNVSSSACKAVACGSHRAMLSLQLYVNGAQIDTCGSVQRAGSTC